MVKPVTGSLARGLRLLERTGEGARDQLGRRRSWAELAQELAAEPWTGFVVQERLYPHPALERLSGSDALQCLRIVTLVEGAGRARVLYRALRIVVGTGATDSFRAEGGRATGNLIARVEQNGRLALPVGVAPGGFGLVRVAGHPSTGRLISEGVEVPWAAGATTSPCARPRRSRSCAPWDGTSRRSGRGRSSSRGTSVVARRAIRTATCCGCGPSSRSALRDDASVSAPQGDDAPHLGGTAGDDAPPRGEHRHPGPGRGRRASGRGMVGSPEGAKPTPSSLTLIRMPPATRSNATVTSPAPCVTALLTSSETARRARSAVASPSPKALTIRRASAGAWGKRWIRARRV